VHAVATTPAQRLGLLLRSFTQPYQPSPIWQSGRPAHCPFRGLLGVHSRYGLHTRAVTVYRDSLSEGFSHFVSSIAAPVASGWSVRRVGFAPTGKAPPFHGARHLRTHERSKEHPYSITSSAVVSNEDGISRPIALAAFRLRTSSYLVGDCTGSSLGFAPLRMRSTYSAARLNCSAVSGP
jgi:hypothetical protein